MQNSNCKTNSPGKNFGFSGFLSGVAFGPDSKSKSRCLMKSKARPQASHGKWFLHFLLRPFVFPWLKFVLGQVTLLNMATKHAEFDDAGNWLKQISS